MKGTLLVEQKHALAFPHPPCNVLLSCSISGGRCAFLITFCYVAMYEIFFLNFILEIAALGNPLILVLCFFTQTARLLLYPLCWVFHEEQFWAEIFAQVLQHPFPPAPGETLLYFNSYILEFCSLLFLHLEHHDPFYIIKRIHWVLGKICWRTLQLRSI